MPEPGTNPAESRSPAGTHVTPAGASRVLVVGSSNTDMTVRLPGLPAPGETVLGGSFLTGHGGKGANQAVAAARAGAKVTFVTAVGDDSLGAAALDHYKAEGIDVSHARTVGGTSSGVALIFVGGAGENMIGVASGANAELSARDIERLPDNLFEPGGLLLIAGLEVPLDAVARAVRRGRDAGMVVVLNPAPAPTALLDTDTLGGTDVITPNRGELALLTGGPVGTVSEVTAAARALGKRGPRFVVATLGADGCLVSDRSAPTVLPAFAVEPVDTVGAGDTFTATLAVALSEGRPLIEAASWASAAAALAVTRPGAQSSLPKRNEIDALYATRP